jgi:hypothetical protein
MEEKQYKFGKQFKAVAKASSKNKKKKLFKCSIPVLYMTCAISSFVFLAIFGLMAIRLDTNCNVQGTSGRCCHCWTANKDPTVYATRMQGQSMPTFEVFNNLFYGAIMVVNSLFGIYYVYSGVRSENKYLLSIMVLTQVLENGRGILDVVSEQLADRKESALLQQLRAAGLDLDETPQGLIIAREVIIAISCLLMFGGFFLLRPMYKKFGWRIFRRGGAKREIREMYKAFQRYRACNLIDIQSSFLLFIIYVMYLEIVTWNYYWVIFVMFISDVLASRAMVMFMKQENPRGFALCIVAKLSVIIWWVCVLGVYATCFNQYQKTRFGFDDILNDLADDGGDRSWARAPNITTLSFFYRNSSTCIRSVTSMDTRTTELIALNFLQALIFRLISFFLAYKVYRNFGGGLVEVFYTGYKAKAPTSSMEEKLMDEGVGQVVDDEPNSDDGKWEEEDAEENDEEEGDLGKEMNS